MLWATPVNLILMSFSCLFSYVSLSRVIVSCFFGRPLSIVKRRQPFRIAVEQLGVLVGTEVPAKRRALFGPRRRAVRRRCSTADK